MRNRFFWSLVIGLALVLPALADGPSLADVLSGKAAPHAVKLKDMDDTWRRVDAQIASLLGIFSQMSMSGMRPGLPAALFTKGETVTIGQDSYLIAYQYPGVGEMKIPFLSEMGMGDSNDTPPVAGPITADTEVRLTLLHLATAGSFVNFEPFNLEKELEHAQSTNARFAELEKTHTEKAQQTTSTNNLKQIATGVMMYTQDNEARFPRGADWSGALTNYIGNEKALLHPVTNAPYIFNVALSGKAVVKVKDHYMKVLAFEATTWSDGSRIVAFVDGHVSKIDAEEWALIAKRSGVLAQYIDASIPNVPSPTEAPVTSPPRPITPLEVE